MMSLMNTNNSSYSTIASVATPPSPFTSLFYDKMPPNQTAKNNKQPSKYEKQRLCVTSTHKQLGRGMKQSLFITNMYKMQTEHNPAYQGSNLIVVETEKTIRDGMKEIMSFLLNRKTT